MRLLIIGAGAWGTALAVALSVRHDVILFTRNPAHAASLIAHRCNNRYLPEIPLPEAITITTSWPEAIAQSELALIATPFAALAEIAAALAQAPSPLPFLIAAKGIDPETLELPHLLVARIWKAHSPHPLPPHGLFTGPTFALEIARLRPTAALIAAHDGEWAKHLIHTLPPPSLRLYASSDPTGAAIGGAVKNVIAIAAGIADGLGLGLNARAALITRGLAEIARLAVALGGNRETLMGLAGLGDLLLTATGELSRNRQLGLLLARGTPLDEARRQLGHVVEGIPTATAAVRLADRHGVEMPITRAVYRLLTAPALRPDVLVDELLARDPKFETS
ncbi:MAG: NAD(P)-dependent glycerol-3-phosphate dehydrogenase [Hydrogenophilus sp.]|nr:NAD(P)-dependent glycerol-3-phosphate dehydrogenase [Hydrogenophilus sp.]